ncbi:MAG: S-layer homology domain-containing protein [Eubacteriales bacterium]|nr:S-layer homology domain-containing protein [Eubacteriales bacterium]
MLWNKRTASIALAGLLLCSTPTAWAANPSYNAVNHTRAAIIQQGLFGESMLWTLDAEGTLTITGGGEMPYASAYPWAPYNDAIRHIVIDDLITGLGDGAFAGCYAETVTLPAQITALGNGTFQNCPNLTSITIPDRVTNLGQNLFSGCTHLESVELPEAIASIASGAFASCTSLQTLTFLGNAPDFAEDTFTGSSISIHYPAHNESWTPDILQDYGGNLTWVADGAHTHTYGKPAFVWQDDHTCTATFTCIDADDTQTVPCAVASETTAATCTEAGTTIYTASAELEGETYTDIKTVAIPATGHDYTSTFAWAESEDGGYTATANLVCSRCDGKQAGIAAAVTEQTTAATCTESGETVYTATAEAEGKTYTDTKTVELPATGHKYESKFTWTDAEDGGYAATASLGCSRCDGKQAGIAAAVTEQTTAATCTEAGATVYTASAEVEGETYTDIKTVAIPALGHKWDDGVVTKEPTTTESGIKTYTCTVCMQTRTEAIDPIPDDSKPVYEIFSDLSAGAWYIDAIQYAYDNHIMAGMGNGTFEPNSSMTRAMVAQIVYHMAGAPEVSGDSPFQDVPSGRWYSDAILWASQNNVVAGMGDGTFRPSDIITREQYASILYHFANQPAVSGSLDFPDAAEVGSWAADAMLWANQRGIITGTKKGSTVMLEPKGSATRAQSAMILMHYLTTES